MSFVLVKAITLSSVSCKSKKSLESKISETITVLMEKNISLKVTELYN